MTINHYQPESIFTGQASNFVTLLVYAVHRTSRYNIIDHNKIRCVKGGTLPQAGFVLSSLEFNSSVALCK